MSGPMHGRAGLLGIAVAMVMGALLPASAMAAPPPGVTGMALDGSAELAWQPVPGASGYKVYRGTSPTAVSTPLMASPLTPVDPSLPASFTDITAVNGTTYYYAVRSITAGVESANSRIVAVTPRARGCSGANAVAQENCFPGTSNWDVPLAAGVDGYATASSLDHGESVDLKVQATGGTTADLEIFRSGYYGGAGARLYSTILDVPVAAQPACVNDPNLGLLDCANWSVSQTLTTTTAWPSGVYLVRVRRDDTGASTHILFTVRDDARHAEILFPVPDTSYQAYNYWGGKSLYDDKSSVGNTVSGSRRAVKVSFDRPYQAPHDDILRDWYTRADYPTVSWLERSGYDVAYGAVSDLERGGARLRDHRVIVSGAHDEYWSAAMRAAAVQARDAGVDLLFTGANEIYWKVRFEPSPVSARQDRVLVNYKSTQSGGPDPSGIPTGTWRDPAGANQPENALAGGMYIGQKNFEYYPLKVSAAEGHDRIWRYSGLDTQPAGGSASVGTALVGWEWDARVSNGREPSGVTTLASSPVTGDILADAGRDYVPGSAVSHATKYLSPSGALVFATGTNHWNWGLGLNALDEGEPDRRIRQATTNVLFDMGAFPATPAADIVLDDPSAPPTVNLRIPAASATDVDPATTVRATFSRPMDPASISSSTFALRRPDGTVVPATVTYDDVSFTATLRPTAALALETAYTARLESTVRAANGVALAAPLSWSFETRPPDRTPPQVSITAPANNATVIASATLAASASDGDAVSGVQFKLDGEDLGAEDTSAPYSYAWDARAISAGPHTLTAVARDPSGNSGTSAAVNVTVDPTGLVTALGFEEASGTAATDSSGKGNGGTLAGGVARSLSGKSGRALSFDGVDDIVTVSDASSLDLTNAMTLEAWVRPSATGGWRTALMKEQPGGLVYGIYSDTSSSRPSAHVYTSSEHDTRGTAQVPAAAWTHLAATYDGANLRIYLNGAQASSTAVTGSMITSTGALRIGGNTVWGEWFSGLIDEVRVYRRVLTAGEIQTDMAGPIVAPDTQPPTPPAGLTAAGSIGQAQLSWTAATDNNGVTRYNVHRSQTSGFTPTAANRIAQPTGTSYADTGLGAGTYYYRVTAEDGAGNVGGASNEASATATADTTAPSVSLTAPTGGTLTGTVNLTASATDNVAVAGVQFQLDGANLGSEDSASPYSFAWDSRTATNASHVLRAIARDAAGNTTTSSQVTVTVDNPPVDTTELVGAWGFEEASGTAVTDGSGSANNGIIGGGATRSAAGRFGKALSFDGVDDMVTVADSASLDLTTAMTIEAWVNPSAAGNWRTVMLKEQASALAYGLYSNGNSNRPSAHVYTAGAEHDTRGTATVPVNTWTHLSATYDGATLRIYVNGTQASSTAVSGSLVASTGALRIGGNSIWGEYFAGLIDEMRVYRRVLTAGEIQIDMNNAILPPVVDTQAPTAPGGLTATGAIGQAQLSWTGSSDNVGVTRYNVHRSQTAGFTPAAANRVAQVTGTSWTDAGLAAGTYHYRVTAEDAVGNVSAASAQASATATTDTSAPTVSLTAPANGATVSGTQNVAATASDNVGVAGVRFQLDGANLGAEDTSSPFSASWDSRGAANGTHTLRAVARDASGNSTTSTAVTVVVDNPAVDTSGLVGAWGFEEGAGTAAGDASTERNDGVVSGGASWADDGRYGKALSFDGVNDRVDVADAASLDLSTTLTMEAWVRPSQHGDWHTVMLKEKSGGMSYGMYGTAWNDQPSGHINPGTEDWTRGTAALPVNQWSHLATTWDGATLRLYVDGTQVSSHAIGGSIPASTLPLRIGGNAIWGEYFKGTIDEVRLYKRALTATEIASDMTTPVRADAPPAAGPETKGQYSGVQSWPLVPVHIAMLSNGKVAVWDGFDAALNSERIWDPATNTFTPIPSGRNLFCAAHVTLPDGRLFIAGGHIAANEGLKDTQIFNPSNNSWFRGTDMARARWYPTATTLPDGRILVVSGDNITLNQPGFPVPLRNGAETLPEIYDVDRNTWTPLPAGSRRMPLYPFMFVLPDGRVFDAGPDPQTRTMDPATGQWTPVATSPIDGHSAVMYRPGKILKSGTWADPDFPGIQSTNRAAAIDMTETTPSWREVAPMHHGRSYHTLTALADGTVLSSGGATETDGIDVSNAVFPAEIWDPVTDTWKEVAANQRPRLYHSSSVLLPDGRVLLAGGGAYAPATNNESNAEIYSPPYLFKGPRPTITSAPATLRYGETFSVSTPQAANIDKVALVRMGSVTHNFDMDQRFMHLTKRAGGTSGTLDVDAPANAGTAPPGYYYLMVLDDNGVPSVASMVKINPPVADTAKPTPPASLTASVSGADVALNWNAATDNVGVTGYRVHRSTTPGFTPTAANRIATVSSVTSYTDRDLAANTYYYLVVAVDAAGNVSDSSLEASAVVGADTTAPSVAVSAPAAGARITGTVPVTATANDNRSVASVQFKLDGANLGPADTSAPYSISWDSRTAADGTRRLTAVARDAAGNSATSDPVDVTVDNGAPPTVSVTAPANGASVAGSVAVTADAADDRGITSVQFKLDGNDLGAADPGAPYSVTWNSTTASNANHTLTAIARDTDGNTTTSAGVTVTVANGSPGLVAAYGFEEAGGTTATDASGTANAGTVSGALRSATGRFGAALSFDGVNDWVTVPDANPLDLTTAMTLEAWVRPSTLSSWRTVLMKEQSGGLVYGLYANANNNRPSAHVFTDGEDDVRGTAALALNAWTHLAATYDGTTLRMYVNGVQASSKAIGGPLVTSGSPLRIGGNGVWPEWFAGLIDEVRIYGRVLPSAEIQADMNRAVVP